MRIGRHDFLSVKYRSIVDQEDLLELTNESNNFITFKGK